MAAALMQSAARAANLTECITGAKASPQTPELASLLRSIPRMTRWQAALQVAGPQAFLGRLNALGLTEGQARVLSADGGTHNAPAETLRWLDDLHQAAGIDLGEEHTALTAVQWQQRFASAASTWLAEHPAAAAFSAHAQNQLLQALDRHLAHVLRAPARNPAAEGDVPESVIHTRPVALRCAARLMARWRVNVDLLLTRWQSDCRALEAWLGHPVGRIQHIDTDLSDPHCGGATVCRLHGELDQRLIYKPRDVQLEHQWAVIVDALRSAGLQLPAQPRILLRDGYGWAQHVDRQACASRDDLLSYCKGSGAILALTWLLGARDLHDGNLLASPQGPVLLDLETLLQPLAASPATPGTNRASHTLSQLVQGSVFKTSLLPAMVCDAQGQLADIGALGGLFGGLSNADYDFEPGPDPWTPALRQSLPLTAALLADMVSMIDDGFVGVCRYAMAERANWVGEQGLLTPLKHLRVRVLLRDTRVYLALLRQSITDEALASGLDRSLVFESLTTLRHASAAGECYAAAIEAEIAALEALDVPALHVRSDRVTLETLHGTAPTWFSVSGWQALKDRLANLDESSIDRQLRFVHLAMAARAASLDSVWSASQLGGLPPTDARPAAASPTAAVLSPLEGARRVADRLMAQAIACDDDGLTWLATVPLKGTSGWQVASTGAGLDHGQLGMALFFAAWAPRGGGLAALDTALRALVPALGTLTRQQPKQPAQALRLSAALSGLAHHLERAGQRLAVADEPVATLTRRLSETITSLREHAARAADGSAWQRAANPDFVADCAWLRWGCAVRASDTPDLSVVAQRVLAASSGSSASDSSTDRALKLARAAAALGTWSRHESNETATRLAEGLLQSSLRVAGTGTASKELQRAWLEGYALHAEPTLRQRLVQELQRCATSARQRLSVSHSWPVLDGRHGGIAELIERLLDARHVLRWGEGLPLAQELTSRLLERAHTTGHFVTLPAGLSQAEAPGYEVGLAGLGLTLLRACDPDSAAGWWFPTGTLIEPL